jgi:hypothetical protein
MFNFNLIINNENSYCNTPATKLSLLIMRMRLKGMMEMKLQYGLGDLKDIDLMTFLPIIMPVFVVSTILILIALIDLYRHRKTSKNVLPWVLIILFANTLGPILYFTIGRKDSERI